MAFLYLLGFCVERHDSIKTFQPEPFWEIKVAVQATEFRKLVLDWERVRLFDREVASTFHQKMKDVKQARYSIHNIQYSAGIFIRPIL